LIPKIHGSILSYQTYLSLLSGSLIRKPPLSLPPPFFSPNLASACPSPSFLFPSFSPFHENFFPAWSLMALSQYQRFLFFLRAVAFVFQHKYPFFFFPFQNTPPPPPSLRCGTGRLTETSLCGFFQLMFGSFLVAIHPSASLSVVCPTSPFSFCFFPLSSTMNLFSHFLFPCRPFRLFSLPP